MYIYIYICVCVCVCDNPVFKKMALGIVRKKTETERLKRIEMDFWGANFNRGEGRLGTRKSRT